MAFVNGTDQIRGMHGDPFGGLGGGDAGGGGGGGFDLKKKQDSPDSTLDGNDGAGGGLSRSSSGAGAVKFPLFGSM